MSSSLNTKQSTRFFLYDQHGNCLLQVQFKAGCQLNPSGNSNTPSDHRLQVLFSVPVPNNTDTDCSIDSSSDVIHRQQLLYGLLVALEHIGVKSSIQTIQDTNDTSTEQDIIDCQLLSFRTSQYILYCKKMPSGSYRMALQVPCPIDSSNESASKDSKESVSKELDLLAKEWLHSIQMNVLLPAIMWSSSLNVNNISSKLSRFIH